MVLSARVVYSVAFFILVMVLLFSTRPSWLFDRFGSVIPFGVGPDHTLFNMGSITVACAAISLFAFAIIDLVYTFPASDARPMLVRIFGGAQGETAGYA